MHTDDGLIPVTEELLGSRTRAVAAGLTALLFLGVLVGSGLLDTLLPVPAPKLEGWEAQLDAKRRNSAKFADGSLASLIEYDRRLTSTTRRLVLPAYSRALYEWFRFGNPEVVVGSEGWLFLRSRVEPSVSDPRPALELAANRLAALERAVALRGTHLLVAPIPRKSALYSDRLPLGVDSAPELESLFEAELTRRGVHFAPIIEAYLDYLRDSDPATSDPLYNKVGTHWTARAEVIAARETARASGLWQPEDELPSVIFSWHKKPQELDLLTFAGIEVGLKKGTRLANARELENLLLIDPGPKPRPTSENPETIGRVAVAGTSFSARRQFPQFVSHFIREPIYNAAQPGANPVDSALDVLRSTSPGVPELLILELPDHSAFLNDNLSAVERAFELVEADELKSLSRPKDWWFDPELRSGALTPLSASRPVATLIEGRVAHDGGAVLAIRLRGSVDGGSAMIRVNYSESTATVEWKPGASTVLVPLIEPSLEAAMVRVTASASGSNVRLRIEPEGVEVVGTTMQGGERTVEWIEGQPRSSWADHPGDEPLPRLSTLVSRVPETHTSGALALSVRLGDSWVELPRFSGLDPGGLVAVSLAAHAGERLTDVRLDE